MVQAVSVGLPRPRTAAMRVERQFNELVQHIGHLLGVDHAS
jgi:hypothetical protein